MPQFTKQLIGANKEEVCKLIIAKLLNLTQEYQNNLKGKQAERQELRNIIYYCVLILTASDVAPEDKIKNFYAFLNKDQLIFTKQSKKIKIVDVIKKDSSLPALNYLKGIAIISAILVTGIIPGLLIAGIVYKVYGTQPLDFFKSNGSRFIEETDLINKQFLMGKEHAQTGTEFFSRVASQSNSRTSVQSDDSNWPSILLSG